MNTYTPKQLAEQLGVSAKRLRELARDHLGPEHRTPEKHYTAAAYERLSAELTGMVVPAAPDPPAPRKAIVWRNGNRYANQNVILAHWPHIPRERRTRQNAVVVRVKPTHNRWFGVGMEFDVLPVDEFRWRATRTPRRPGRW